jgi:CHASE3 domain sensor protein
MASSAFQIAFWCISILFAIFGLVVTIIGWRVNAANSRSLAHKKDIHDSIDDCIKALSDLEDLAYSFWLDADEKAKPYQLIVGHKRLTHRLKQLQSLTSAPIPSHEMISLRKSCTLDCESRTQPLSGEDVRIKRISLAASNILQSSILQKSWEARLGKAA